MLNQRWDLVLGMLPKLDLKNVQQEVHIFSGMLSDINRTV